MTFQQEVEQLPRTLRTVVGYVATGMRNREIAQQIGTTENVVKNYCREIFDRLGLADRLELAVRVAQVRVAESRESQQ